MSPAGGPDVFARATTRLVVLFTAIVVALVVVSGVVMYLTLTTNIAGITAGPHDSGAEVERERASRSISSLRWQLVALDGAIIVAVGALGLWYAHRTLRPIREVYGAQKRFVSDASHELRTPLAVMKADFEVALRAAPVVARAAPGEPSAGASRSPAAVSSPPAGAPPPLVAEDPAALREALHSGLEEVDRMSAIVDDLLMLSRIDADQEELRFVALDLGALVRATVEGMRSLADGAGVAVTVTVPPDPVTTTADAAHLERALRNVVRNAVEHSAPGDIVRVELAQGGAVATVSVADTGTGIAAADLAHVFERFYRADSSRASGSGGSGLGLAIVRWIVERHGGVVTAESAVGKGTTLVLRLPLRRS